MRRELQVAGLLTSPLFLGFLAVFCGLLVVMASGEPRVDALLPLIVVLTLQQLALRVVRVGAADIWRLLPGGFTVFIRALALLVLALTLLAGGLWSWAIGQLAFHSVAFGPMVLSFILLSTLSALSIIAIVQRRSGYFIATGALVFGISLELLFDWFPDSLLWWTLALLFAAAWLFACFGKLPAAATSRRIVEPAEAMASPSVSPLLRWQLRFNSPVHNFLQLENRGASRLVVAASVMVLCTLLLNWALTRRGPVDVYPVSGIMGNWLALFFLFEMGVAMTSRARLLWLRTGDGRGGIFLAVERVLLVNLASLSLVAWLLTTLLTALQGISIQPTQAAWALAWFATSGLGPMYLALIAGTLQGWLAKTPMAVVGVAVIIISPILLLPALIVVNVGLDSPNYGLVACFAASILALRFMASWRWRHLDWSKIRVTPHESLMGRARSG